MIAHWHREMVGEGQHIDVAAQLGVVLALYGAPRGWEFRTQELPEVGGAFRTGGRLLFPNAERGISTNYSCKDGGVFLLVQGGVSVVHHTSSIQLVKYMDENKMASDWLKEFDWVWGFSAATITQDVIDRIEEEVCKFLLTKVKKELYQEALKRRILLAPFADSKGIYEPPQLQARDF